MRQKLSFLRWMIFTFCALGLQSSGLLAQVSGGTPRWSGTSGGPDVINLANLNVNLSIPILHRTGRGMDFNYGMSYNSAFYQTVATPGHPTVWAPIDSNMGWSIGGNANYRGFVSATRSEEGCPGSTDVASIALWTDWILTDMNGQTHAFNGTLVYSDYSDGYCLQYPNHGLTGFSNAHAADQSGIILDAVVSGPASNQTLLVQVTYPGASPVPISQWVDLPSSPQAVQDTTGHLNQADLNGNYMSNSTPPKQGIVNGIFVTSSIVGQFNDTLGNAALSIAARSPGVEGFGTISYPFGSNSTGQVVPNYSSHSIQTNFGCSNVLEYTGPSQLLDSITLADGRSYQFTYEPGGGTNTVTGRIQAITLPGGGTITYAYTSSGGVSIDCITGSPLGFTRTLDDGSGIAIPPWNYQISHPNGTLTTTVTDPTGASTAHTFYPIANARGPDRYGTIYAETGSIVKDSTAAHNTVQTTSIVYNGGGCCGPIVLLPILSVQTTTTLPTATSTITSQTTQTYNTLGLPTEIDVYDFGSVGSSSPGGLLAKTSTLYSSINRGLIYDHPASVTAYGPDGSTVTAQTNYTYDGVGVTATSGVPQHLTGINYGNVTAVQTLVSGTNNFQNATYTYNDTGSIATATDINQLATTNSVYSRCSGSLLGSTYLNVSSPGRPATTLSTTWYPNCNVSTIGSSVDLNGNNSSAIYADPYDRPTSTSDAYGNTTTYTYPTASSNTSTTSTSFNNGASISQSLTTYDGLSRPILRQLRQSPTSNNYDSVSIRYNSVGMPSYQSMQYQAVAGSYMTSGSGVQTTYDALGRTTLNTDGGGGYTQYAYSGNDTTITIGPAASTSESLKVKVLETNAGGKLTSVCEVNTLAGSGACGQTTSQTGYLTKYIYSSGVFTVQQNSQHGSTGMQTRTIHSDWLGRTTTETIPELGSNGAPGTITYAYDIDPTGTCSASVGDLVYKKDAAANVTCYTYDNLHRKLSSIVVSGPQASITAQQYFVYDGATLFGQPMQNAKGTLTEAYTCAPGSTCTAKVTDLFASTYPESSSGTYTGRVTKQVWESTPNSGGYFMSQETYYPNGALALSSASKICSTAAVAPSISYGLDGEGRVNTVTDTTNSINLVTAVTYSLGGMNVSYGNGDTDTLGRDSATGRKNLSTHTIAGSNGFVDSGTLTWNANGSLGQFAWSDGNDTSKSQTCTYSADALNRLAAANCGSVWNQSFTYDAFGNITKSANGGISYGATYSPSTNQVLSGVSAAYDVNGNQTLTNGVSSMIWDANHNLVLTGSTGMTYDALGRLVEFSGGQIIWGAGGERLATYFNGASTTSVGLPAGAEAYYTSGALTAIRHKDWLGSSRLATTWAHGIYAKAAYAPFGEAYNTTGASDQDFAGKTQDSVATLFDYPARKYDPNAGRWTSPDPGGWGVVDIKNPQSFNRYSYVLNNPLSAVDPTGLECVWDDGSYDSADDPNTGSQAQCEGGDMGGTWISHDIFANSRYYRGDSTDTGDEETAALVKQISGCSTKVSGGAGANLLVADSFTSGFGTDQTSYVLASAAWESGPGGIGKHMVEMGPRSYFEQYQGRLGNTSPGDGFLYRGRGFIQITGKSNYTNWSKQLGVDLVGNPGQAASSDIAAEIAVEGLDKGSFTGKSLADFMDDRGTTDFVNARRTINGDVAKNGRAIASLAEYYQSILRGGCDAN